MYGAEGKVTCMSEPARWTLGPNPRNRSSIGSLQARTLRSSTFRRPLAACFARRRSSARPHPRLGQLSANDNASAARHFFAPRTAALN